MTGFARMMAVVFAGTLIAQSASAQGGIFDLFGWGDDDPVVEIEPSPISPDTESSPIPPDVERATPTEPLLEHDELPLNIAGAWTVTTERTARGCSLNGTAQISITQSGGYTCELIMRDYCPGSWDGIIRQSCEISITGETIHVDSTVLEALHGPLAGYSPDNFDLQMNDEGSLVGHLRSYGQYPAIWRRVFDGIS